MWYQKTREAQSGTWLIRMWSMMQVLSMLYRSSQKVSQIIFKAIYRSGKQAELSDNYIQLLEHYDWHCNFVPAMGFPAGRPVCLFAYIFYKLSDIVLHLQVACVEYWER